jgi:Tudor domain
MNKKQIRYDNTGGQFSCTHVQLEPTEKLQQTLQTAHMLAKEYPDSLLNMFIYVFWADDKVWYRARVIKYLEITKKFKVIYDDKN